MSGRGRATRWSAFAGLVCAVFLAVGPACTSAGEDPPEPSNGVLAVQLTANTKSALPACTSALVGDVAFVSSPPALYWCNSGGHWVPIPCNPGKSGEVAYASTTQTLLACVGGQWTQVALPGGPQGPAGPQGPQGPAGPQGPPGPSSLAGQPCNLAHGAAGVTVVSVPANGGPISIVCQPTGGCVGPAPSNLGQPCCGGSILCDSTCSFTDAFGGGCTPDSTYVPQACVSMAGVEGRCLPVCLPVVAATAAELPQSTCPAGDACVPCYDPTAADPAAPTGACSIGCDAPKQPPTVLTCPWTGPAVFSPASFPDCSPSCAGAHCAPASTVPAADQGFFAACTGGFCVPDDLIATDIHVPPQTCVSTAGAEGRCLSTCMPLVAARAGELPQDTCAADQKCMPCYDPTAPDPTAPTGACSLACDSPKQAPTVLTCPWTGPAVFSPASFPECSPSCGGTHCAPASTVPAGIQGFFAACTGGFCVPDEFIATDFDLPPQSCASTAGAKGRCLSTCMPSVAAQAGSLAQDVCTADQRCVPCFDPASGSPTGACSLVSCDKP